jgi:transcriptional regulator with XRE-family HTH domain
MTKHQETLAEYVQRIMNEKGLKPKDVEVRSHNQIADSYVENIMKGRAQYPSAVKLQALAVGLGVDGDDLFKIARGVPMKGKSQAEPWPGPVLVKAMQRIVASPEMTRAVQLLLKASPEKIKRFVKILEKEID